jgi:ferredoxin-type protein NapH
MSTEVSPLRMNPGRFYAALRILCQALVWVAVLASPVIGGWQRADASGLSAWSTEGRDLPPALVEKLPPPAEGEAVLEGWLLLGGGTGVEYARVPMLDPVVAVIAATRTAFSPRVLLALLIPLLAGVLLGRVFCGWFCPFGSLARMLQAIVVRIPFWPRRYELGPRRPLRWIVLAACLVLGAVGSQTLVVYALPHLALQQSVQALWLQGGGGAVLGWLLGLVAAGLWLGPTTYCASVCPTGALFGALGRFRILRLRIEQPSTCPRKCHSCDLACWQSLQPSKGDAGPDCDSCARCVTVCPHDNLRIGFRKGEMKKLQVIATLLFCLGLPTAANAQTERVRPALFLDEQREVGDVNVAVGALDYSQVQLDADDTSKVGGSEIRVRLSRGERPAPDSRGRLTLKKHYDGPLVVEVVRDDEVLHKLEWEAPNEPRSTVNRRIYMQKVKSVLAPGDILRVAAVADWTPEPMDFLLPEPQSGRARGPTLAFFLAGLLVGLGVLSLALALARKGPASV